MRFADLPSLMSGPVARGSMASFAVQIGGLALVTVQAILTARLLGAEGYGAVAYVLSLANIMAVLALLGTQQLAVREIARFLTLGDTAGLAGFLRSIRVIFAVASVLGIGLWFIAITGRTGGNDLLVFVALFFPALALAQQTQGILRGFAAVWSALLPYHVLRPLIILSVLLAALLLPFDLTPRGFLIAALAALVATSIAMLIAFRSHSRSLPEAREAAPLGPIAREAAPLFVVSLIALLLAEINTLMLNWWAGAEETGLFQPIARIAPLFLLGMQAVSIRYAPRVSELWTAGEIDRLTAVTRKVTVSTLGFAIAAAVAVLAFGEWILGLFGRDFAANTAALWWVAGAQIVNAACGPVGILLTMSGRATDAVPPRLLGLAVNVALGAWLIPDMGALGAAIAMAGGIVAWNVAMLIAVRRRMGIDPSVLGLFIGR